MRNLIEQLYQLTQDKERLAINAAAIDIRKYNAHVHDFFQYPLGVSFIGVEKPLVAGRKRFPCFSFWICTTRMTGYAVSRSGHHRTSWWWGGCRMLSGLQRCAIIG